MNADLDTQNVGDLSEDMRIVFPTVKLGFGGVDSNSNDFEKDIQRVFDPYGYLSRSTSKKDGFINELSMIDRLKSSNKRNTENISFTFQCIKSSAQRFNH